MPVHPGNTASSAPAGTGEMILSAVFLRLLAVLSAVLIASVLLRLVVQDPGPGALFRQLLIGVFVMTTIPGFITLWLRRLLQQKIISPLETIAAANRRFSEGDLQATLEKLPDGTPREILEIASSREAMLRMIMEISADGYAPLEMGIGINTGTVTVGSIGSEIRMKYGVVGTPVNTAARIEANTFGGQVLVGEETCRAAGDALRVMPPRSAMVKGLKTPLVFYSVAGIAPPWDRTLKTVPPDENGSAIRLPFYYWKMKEKTVISGSSYGETRRIGENWIEADLEEPVAPFENIRLRFEFCVDAHCFEYIDARGLPAEEEGGAAYRLGITAMDPKDRGVLKKWLRETKH